METLKISVDELQITDTNTTVITRDQLLRLKKQEEVKLRQTELNLADINEKLGTLDKK